MLSRCDTRDATVSTGRMEMRTRTRTMMTRKGDKGFVFEIGRAHV